MPQQLAAFLTPQILAYLIGSVGILVEWRAYYQPNQQSFRYWSAAGALLWAAQYILLDAVTAGLTMATTALRTLISAGKLSRTGRHGLAMVFSLVFGLLTALSWQGNISLLPGFAVINTSIALFYLDNRSMRIALLVSSLAWIANDYCWQAWPALIAETVAMLINLKTIRTLNRA
ncbi:YgjV family protein [Methylomonas paludis]|uniref:YgjV family protein n=1 Tax=Methylomonas paludis TaxID=1173101 RepID=A0A975MQG2_9GAMM|nr:YgjV family protein [Methylomonas paludis]QWF71636.1 YgjV family protein [Methylomonas paludis]